MTLATVSPVPGIAGAGCFTGGAAPCRILSTSRGLTKAPPKASRYAVPATDAHGPSSPRRSSSPGRSSSTARRGASYVQSINPGPVIALLLAVRRLKERLAERWAQRRLFRPRIATSMQLPLPAGTAEATKEAEELTAMARPAALEQAIAAADSVAAASGVSPFWTLFYFGADRDIVGLRNMVVQHNDGQMEYIKLTEDPDSTDEKPSYASKRVTVNPGDGFGQFCRFNDAAEKKLLSLYKSIDPVRGKAIGQGVDAGNGMDIQPLLEELFGKMDSSDADAGMSEEHCHILSDSEIVQFEDVADQKFPLGLQTNFMIYICPMTTKEQIRQHDIPQYQNLKFGLPQACDAFQEVPFTGDSHSLGIVPAIDRQQFVCGSTGSSTWVRFDKEDISTYDHNLGGLPTLEDELGVYFPVTHMWVDFSAPTATCALEWFSQTQCVARKEVSLWPMPDPLYRKVIQIITRRLRKQPEPQP